MPGLTLEVDAAVLMRALETGDVIIAKHVLHAAEMTAERIASEARGRVRRRTGRTARGIVVDRARIGVGYIVHVVEPENPGLPGWLEHGTKYMSAKEYLFVSARLEAGAHDQRMREAISDGIEEMGLGR